MNITVVCGGQKPSLSLLKKILQTSDILIAVDRGANCLYEYNIKPNFLIGDFDSINKDVLQFFINNNVEITRFPTEKDYTDSELGFLLAKDLNATKITFLGCSGTRLDHTVGNFALLKRCVDNNIKGEMIDNNNKIAIIRDTITLYKDEYKYFSILPYGGEVCGVVVENAKYEIKGADLAIDTMYTVSNEFLEKPVNIKIKSGLILLITSND